MIESVHTSGNNTLSTPAPQSEKLREVSQKLESTFLAEMLKSAKFGETPEAFGGGIGEDQFASFLRQAHADEMAKSGGLGLSESLFAALSRSVGHTS